MYNTQINRSASLAVIAALATGAMAQNRLGNPSFELANNVTQSGVASTVNPSNTIDYWDIDSGTDTFISNGSKSTNLFNAVGLTPNTDYGLSQTFVQIPQQVSPIGSGSNTNQVYSVFLLDGIVPSDSATNTYAFQWYFNSCNPATQSYGGGNVVSASGYQKYVTLADSFTWKYKTNDATRLHLWTYGGSGTKQTWMDNAYLFNVIPDNAAGHNQPTWANYDPSKTIDKPCGYTFVNGTSGNGNLRSIWFNETTAPVWDMVLSSDRHQSAGVIVANYATSLSPTTINLRVNGVYREDLSYGDQVYEAHAIYNFWTKRWETMDPTTSGSNGFQFIIDGRAKIGGTRANITRTLTNASGLPQYVLPGSQLTLMKISWSTYPFISLSGSNDYPKSVQVHVNQIQMF